MTDRIYTHRFAGTGPALWWDAELVPPLDESQEESRLAAEVFGDINGWKYLGRERSDYGDVLDYYKGARGYVIVIHTQRFELLAPAPKGVTLDKLPEPWVRAEPWAQSYEGYVVRRVKP